MAGETYSTAAATGRRPCTGCGRMVQTSASVEQPTCHPCRRGEPPQSCEWCGRGPAGMQMYRRRAATVCQACYQREGPPGEPRPRHGGGLCSDCGEERLRLDEGGRCTACAHAERVRRERARTPEGRAIEREMEAARKRVAERRRREYEEVRARLAERGGLPGDPLRRAAV